MTKFLVLFIFISSMALQNAEAYPQNVAIPEQSTDREVTRDFETGLAKSTTITVQTTSDVATEGSTYSEQESDSDSTEDFSYPPLKYYIIKNRVTVFALKAVQNHLNTLLTAGHDYVTASLKTLNELPNKTSSIEANITRLTNILQRIEGLDLTKNNFDSFLNKIDLINHVEGLYKNFALLPRLVEIDDNDVLSELYITLDLRIEASLKETIKKLTKIFHNFFDDLDEEEKLRFADVIKSYDNFTSRDTDLSKFYGAVLFLLDNPIW